MDTLWSIFGLMVFLLLVVGFLYLIAKFGKSGLAVKLQAAFRWVLLKLGFVKFDEKGGV